MFISLYRIEPDGKSHFYHIHDQQHHLFDKFTLTVIRGDESGKGVEKHYTFETQKEKDKKIYELFSNKRKEGYKILYTYPKELLLNNSMNINVS
ncbi:MAG: hypothetical protein JW969_18235 [Spirochaetales bacterium]|nr:hypothetical protein [Spirochaetales bacterium]